MKDKNEDKLLAGNESWPILGDLLPEKDCAKIIQKMSGLNRYWHCIEKTMLAQEVLGKGVVTLGSLYIFGVKFDGNYGFEFAPPYEFHSWLSLEDGIIDVALAGAIEKGLTVRDHIGCVLEGREPIILADVPPNWLIYKPYEQWPNKVQ